MEIHFHPAGETDEKEKEPEINQNHAEPFLIVGSHLGNVNHEWTQMNTNFCSRLQEAMKKQRSVNETANPSCLFQTELNRTSSRVDRWVAGQRQRMTNA
jgi:hypothetical protein